MNATLPPYIVKQLESPPPPTPGRHEALARLSFQMVGERISDAEIFVILRQWCPDKDKPDKEIRDLIRGAHNRNPQPANLFRDNPRRRKDQPLIVRPFQPSGKSEALPSGLEDINPTDFFKRIFAPQDNVEIAWKDEQGRLNQCDIRTVLEWEENENRLTGGADGLYYCINPLQDGAKRHADNSLASYRYLLVELEITKKERAEMDLEEKEAANERFFAALKETNLPFAALYTSGDASVHGLVKVNATNYDEWKTRMERIYAFCVEIPGFDPSNKNPSRLSRLPGVMRGDCLQTLLSWDTGVESYEEWEATLEIDDVVEAPSTVFQKRLWPEVEGEAAAELLNRIGQVRCVGADWYVQNNGIWIPTERDLYRPIALEVLPRDYRTQARSLEVIKRLEGEQQIRREQFCGAAKFDAEGGVLLAVQNGTLHIKPKDVKLSPTDPAHGFTIALPVAWDSEARVDLFAEVLMQALPDPQDRELLLDVLATALIPDCRHEAALVCQGEAGTSKSTVIAPLLNIFGKACSCLSMADICHPSGYKLANLHHKLINLATELNTLEMEDTGLFKQLVSGERFTARPIYGKPFEMRSTATLVFLANSLPRFKHGTDAEVRRLRFVRFNHKVVTPDVTLKDRIVSEAPGVFAELVRRAQTLLDGFPLAKPGTFGAETVQRFAVTNDPVGQFVEQCCKLGPSLQCEKHALYDEFVTFRDAHGISEKFDGSAFFKTLYDRFPEVHQIRRRGDGGVRHQIVLGVDLKD